MIHNCNVIFNDMVSIKMKKNNVFHFEIFIMKKMTKDTNIMISIIIQINK